MNAPLPVEVVHAVVAGHARLRVRGLYRNESARQGIETALAGQQVIRLASASVLTGTVLVHYDPARRLEDVLSELIALIGDRVDAGAAREPPSLRRLAAGTPMAWQAAAPPAKARPATTPANVSAPAPQRSAPQPRTDSPPGTPCLRRQC
mgnify:CR=1 FL=1